HQVGEEPHNLKGVGLLPQGVKEGGQQQTDGDLQQNGEHHHNDVVAKGSPEFPVNKEVLPVGKADENAVGRNAVPFVHADNEGIDNGINHVDDNQQDGRQQK